MNGFNNKKILIIASAILLGAVAVYMVLHERKDFDEKIDTEANVDSRIDIKIGEQTFKALVADSQEERAQGLSGRIGLNENELLLFVFENSGRHGFWMKDMLFSIDIVWIDENGRVVHLEKEVSPETFPTTFAPSSVALYVIEGQAGFAKMYGISEGTQVTIPLFEVGG